MPLCGWWVIFSIAGTCSSCLMPRQFYIMLNCDVHETFVASYRMNLFLSDKKRQILCSWFFIHWHIKRCRQEQANYYKLCFLLCSISQPPVITIRLSLTKILSAGNSGTDRRFFFLTKWSKTTAKCLLHLLLLPLLNDNNARYGSLCSEKHRGANQGIPLCRICQRVLRKHTL